MSFEDQKNESMPGDKANSHPMTNKVIDTMTAGIQKMKEGLGFGEQKNILEDKNRFTERDQSKSLKETIGSTMDTTQAKL